jgi:hypothetical protein
MRQDGLRHDPRTCSAICPVATPGVSVLARNDVTVKLGCRARVVSAANVRLKCASPTASLLITMPPIFDRASTSRL